MKLALACASCLVVATAAEAAPEQQQRQSSAAKRSAGAAELWSLQQLPGGRDSRLPSPSELQELMDGLPLMSDRNAGDDGGKGFSFKVKPGKGVKAVARLRF